MSHTLDRPLGPCKNYYPTLEIPQPSTQYPPQIGSLDLAVITVTPQPCCSGLFHAVWPQTLLAGQTSLSTDRWLLETLSDLFALERSCSSLVGVLTTFLHHAPFMLIAASHLKSFFLRSMRHSCMNLLSHFSSSPRLRAPA